MMLSRRALFLAAAVAPLAACARSAEAQPSLPTAANEARYAASPFRRMSEAQWRERLSPDAFRVLRTEATERAGTSPLEHEERPGVFACAGCGLDLFRSEWKYASGSGWPSFWRVIRENVGTKRDFVLLYPRTEYHCARCLGHQGHIFNDGPRPTGLRYCNNGVALRFVAA